MEEEAAAKALIEEQNKKQKQRLKNIAFAQDQMKQHQHKLELEEKEKKLALEEGQKIAELDQFYKQKQKEAETKRWENALALRKELNDMKADAKKYQEIEKIKDEEHEKRIQTWVTRKSRQNQLKKQIEKQLLTDSYNQRMRLGETQAKLNIDADTKLNEQISQRVKQRNEKAQKDAQDQLKKKKNREKEIREFYDNHVTHFKILIDSM